MRINTGKIVLILSAMLAIALAVGFVWVNFIR
jgi:hypothetical protein